MSHRTSTCKASIYGFFAVLAIRLFGALPWRCNRVIGSFVGWLLRWLPNEHSRIARLNLERCLPQENTAAQQTLFKKTLHEAGRGALEVAYVWRQPQQALRLIRHVHGKAMLDQALADGRAVVILAPHLGCWELLNHWLASHYALHVLYMPSGMPALDRLIARSRETFSSTTHPATARGLVGLVRALRQGAMTAVLPDQVPERRQTRFIPFFGQPASTATLAWKMTKDANALAFCCFAKRLPKSEGFDIIIEPASAAFYEHDVDTALTTLNRDMEKLVRMAPSQYLWSYRRFRRTPPGAKKFYRD